MPVDSSSSRYCHEAGGEGYFHCQAPLDHLCPLSKHLDFTPNLAVPRLEECGLRFDKPTHDRTGWCHQLGQRAVNLSKIQDVTFGMSGILARILGVGYVYVETSGQSSRIEMLAIPSPQKLCDLIQNQMALIKKEEMMEMARAMKNQQ